MVWSILENFGKFDIFGPQTARGGGANLSMNGILEIIFFSGPVTFLKIGIFKKKKISGGVWIINLVQNWNGNSATRTLGDIAVAKKTFVEKVTFFYTGP